MKLKCIINILEKIFPLSLQETYDNAGLLYGDENSEIHKALICIDVTEDVINEAVKQKCNLLISHHPLIFKPIKKLNGYDFESRLLIKAIKNDIALYAVHTNIDNVLPGVNGVIAKKLGLTNTQIIQGKKGLLKKLVTFCPLHEAEKVRNALFEAGAGHIGNYDQCSFNVNGTGSFRAGENTNPFAGTQNQLHFESEIRIETIFPAYKEKDVLKQLLTSHPYEEIAYDIYPLENTSTEAGAGIFGKLKKEVDEFDFLQLLKKKFQVPCIKHSPLLGKKIKNVALCGGAGSFLIQAAKNLQADIFISADIKYHDFFQADKKILLADIGHYESEQFTKEFICNILNEKIPNFTLQISKTNSNPVNYF